MKRTPRICLALAAAALVLRLALALLRAPIALDRLFVPDDTYYTLAIARSIARGLGPTADGVHLTSGFQPLLGVLLAVPLRLRADPDLAFRCALAIGAVSDAATAYLLGHLAHRMKGERAAILATAIWTLSPSAVATSLNGLETSLSVALMLGALAAWTADRRLLTGALLGLGLFARVDQVFFVVVLGLATLLRRGPRATALTAAGAIATIGPWWVYALSRFGTIVPESGAAVREQTRMYQALGMVIRDQVAWAAGAIVGPPFFDSAWLREALGSGASAIGFVVGIAFVAGALFIARRRIHDALSILAVTSSCLFVFYALYLPATWFFRRYLVPIHAFSALVVALGVIAAWDRRDALRTRAVALAAAVCLLAALGTIYRFATTTPEITVDQGHHGVKGYREPARQILALAPEGAVIGSFQSGALGWLADGSGRTVANLDGVVDRGAALAVRDRTLAAHARARGITHLADWEVNVRLFLERSGDPRLGRSALRPLGAAEPQGDGERFVLYAITWPE